MEKPKQSDYGQLIFLETTDKIKKEGVEGYVGLFNGYQDEKARVIYTVLVEKNEDRRRLVHVGWRFFNLDDTEYFDKIFIGRKDVGNRLHDFGADISLYETATEDDVGVVDL